MAIVDPSRPVARRPTCLLCLQVIKAKERLVLHNSSSRHVIPVLEELLCEFYPASTTVVLHAEASICRSCVRSLEKFQRLRKDFPLPVGRLTKTSATQKVSHDFFLFGSHLGVTHLFHSNLQRSRNRFFPVSHVLCLIYSQCDTRVTTWVTHVIFTHTKSILQSDWRRQDSGDATRNVAIVTRRIFSSRAPPVRAKYVWLARLLAYLDHFCVPWRHKKLQRRASIDSRLLSSSVESQ